MAIDLPPAIPPQAVSAEFMMKHARAEAYTGEIGGYPVRVSGPHRLSKAELDRIFATAKTPSGAVKLIAAAISRNGNLLVTTLYATRKGTVFIHAIQSRVSKVEGPKRITRFFHSLEGERDLTKPEFERARIMADVYAGRSGTDYEVTYADDADLRSKTLVLKQKGAGASENTDTLYDVLLGDSTDLDFEVNNHGNRFAGRYLANLGISHAFAQGTEISFGVQEALTDYGESRDGINYEAMQFKLDHVFSWGLVGIDASHIEYVNPLGTYTQDNTSACSIPGPPLGPQPAGCVTTDTFTFDSDAEIDRVGIFGEHVLAGDAGYRLNLFERIEYIDSTVVSRDPSQFVETNNFAQDEKYTTAELGLRYLSAEARRNLQHQWYSQLAVKAGLDKDDGTFGAQTSGETPTAFRRTAEFLMWKPALGVQLTWANRLVLRADFQGQFADKHLPQQQQWVLGGPGNLSGFLPGVLVGDSGYFLSGDVSKTWSLDGADYGLHFFMEYGSAQYDDEGSSDPDYGDNRGLADAGVRLTMDFGKWVDVEIVSAHRIGDDNINREEDARIKKLEADLYVKFKLTL